jgi:hypothetical protein
MPDRGSTSPAARKLWQQYANRGEIDSFPFDDRDNPKTPPTIDDCQLVGNELLDQSYDGVLGVAGNKAQLLKNHMKMIERLTPQFERRELEKALLWYSNEYFDQRYYT